MRERIYFQICIEVSKNMFHSICEAWGSHDLNADSSLALAPVQSYVMANEGLY